DTAFQRLKPFGTGDIVLDPSRAEARHSIALNAVLPGKKLLAIDLIEVASLFQRQQATADSRHDLCLAPNYPPLGFGGWQIGECQPTAVRTDDPSSPFCRMHGAPAAPRS